MRRRDFVPTAVRAEMGTRPYWHSICRQVTEKVLGIKGGIARPGKTAFERAKKANRV